MKLNCDLGEKVNDNDHQIMPLIDLANIACGFHASDPLTMQTTVQLAVDNNVIIGAHPSYPDKAGFGRRSMAFSSQELTAIIQYQVGALNSLCQNNNTQVSYVKPHGALYNDMMTNSDIFHTVCAAIAQLDSQLILMIQALPDTQRFVAIANQYNISLWFEAFADRAYDDEGCLVPRAQKGAVIHDVKEVVARCQHLLNFKQLLSINNKVLNLQVDTLCIHGDTPTAVELAKQLNNLFSEKIIK